MRDTYVSAGVVGKCYVCDMTVPAVGLQVHSCVCAHACVLVCVYHHSMSPVLSVGWTPVCIYVHRRLCVSDGTWSLGCIYVWVNASACGTGFTMEVQRWVGMEQPTCLCVICVCSLIIPVNTVMV